MLATIAVKFMTCEDIKTLLSEGGQLIDVRSSVEFSQGALNGAINMPVEAFQYLSTTIDRSRPVLLYCRSGQRSALAKQFLETTGFDDVHNIGSYGNYAYC